MKTLYYTSTGNNLYIAKQIGGELLSIPQLMKNEVFDIEQEIVAMGDKLKEMYDKPIFYNFISEKQLVSEVANYNSQQKG